MKVNDLINTSFKIMPFLFFLFPLLAFYCIVEVGAGGHASDNGVFLLAFIYSILLCLMMLGLKMAKSKGLLLVMRFCLFIAFLPGMIFIASVVSYLFGEPDFDIFDLIAAFISVVLFVAILLCLVRIIKWRGGSVSK